MESKIVKAKARSPKDKQQEWGSWGRENELYLESNALLPTTSGAVLRPSEGFFRIIDIQDGYPLFCRDADVQ